MTFIDSNVLISLLVEDSMTEKARTIFFKVIQENINCLIEDSVVAEVFFVTTSKKLYGLDRRDIVARLRPIIALPQIYHDYKEALIEAIEKFARTNLDFVDCLALSYQENNIVDKIISFDKKIAKTIQ